MKKNDQNQKTKTRNIQEKLQKLESELISEVKWEMDYIFQETVQNIKNDELTSRDFGYFLKKQNEEIWDNRLQIQYKKEDYKKDNKNNLPIKIFMPRESYLTHLFKVPHVRCIYNIFCALLSILTIHTFIQDYVIEGRINLGLETIQASYGGLHIGLCIWLCMHAVVFGLYFVFKLWSRTRFLLRNNKSLHRFWNYSCSFIFVIFQITFAYIVSINIIKFKISIISSTAVILEMTRLMMKMHAFVRTSAGFQLQKKLKTDDNDSKHEKPIPVSKFSKYLYFLFAPTLLFREEYPRTKTIRWKFVGARLFEIIAVNFLQAYLYERYLTPYYKNFGRTIITPAEAVQVVFGTMMPAIVIFLSGFYVILHSTQNAMAEMLRFADRMFYKDWWTSGNYAAYYRTWNIIVHDWLYEYIYKDIYTYVFKGSKTASIIIVFFSSAVVHEYIISILLRFVYPFMFFLFMIFSVTVMFLFKSIGKDWGNLFLWFTFITGNGMVVSFYSMEYYSRQNCPVGDQWYDYLIPVSWSCNGIVSNVIESNSSLFIM